MTEQLIVGTTRAGGEAIVSLEGELDLATIGALRTALMAAVSSSAASVIVDTARLSFMDAIGLGVLIAAHRRFAATGRRLTLRHPTGIVERVLDITGPTHHLSVERSEAVSAPLSSRRRPHDGLAGGASPRAEADEAVAACVGAGGAIRR
jgi:anti-sigma B factor antagonist